MITTRDARSRLAGCAAAGTLTSSAKDQSLQLISLWSDCALSRPTLGGDRNCARMCSLPLAVAMVGAQFRGKPDRWPHVLQKLRTPIWIGSARVFPNTPTPTCCAPLRSAWMRLKNTFDAAIWSSLSSRKTARSLRRQSGRCGSWIDMTLQTRWINSWICRLRPATRIAGLRIHDLVLDYLRSRLGVDGLIEKHRRFLQCYARSMSESTGPKGQMTDTFSRISFGICAMRGRDDEAVQLLTDFRWMQAKLDACGITALLADYDWFASSHEMRNCSGKHFACGIVVCKRLGPTCRSASRAASPG